MTPLEEKLLRRIRATGPMTVADYMAACLGDPEYGYYVRREPFGRGGDFVTAPEVSQMFGELVGLWAVATWQAMGAPSEFALAELGPGRGTLTADAMRAAAIRPEFAKAARLHFVETSERLRSAQAQTLGASGVNATWHSGVDEIPAGPAILIANEFFDALPIRQFVRTDTGWAERMVGIGDNGRLAFGLRPVAAVPGRVAAAEGSIVETADASAAVVRLVAERLVRDSGAALVIDYGYAGLASGDTLQAVQAHRYDDPLAAPGEADLTAHVDFTALAAAARAGGAEPRAVIPQGEFLMRAGLEARSAALAKGKDAATRDAILAASERLAGPQAMGTLFKVLAISSPSLALPIFDDKPAGA